MHTSSTISVDGCYVDEVTTTSEFFQGTKMTRDTLLPVYCTKTGVNLHSQPGKQFLKRSSRGYWKYWT